MNRIFLSLVCLFFSIKVSLGQNNNFWIDVKEPFGGDLEDIIKTNSGILYGIEFHSNSWFRSDDDGLNWTQIQPLFNGAPLIDNGFASRGPSGNIWLVPYDGAGTNAKLYVSNNEGIDWQLVSQGMPLTIVEETYSGSLIARNDSSIFRSTDNGVTWEQVFTSFGGLFGIQNLATMPNGDLVFNIASGVAYRSEDDGQNWQEVSQPTAGVDWLFIAASGTLFWRDQSGNSFFRSTDDGATWTQISLDNLPYKYISSLYSLPSGRLLGADGLSEKILFSDDDGVTWQVLPCEYNVLSLKDTPILPDGTIFGAAKGSLHRSNDGGLTWQFSANGLPFSIVRQLEFVTADTFFAATPDGIWRTFDQGQNWAKLTDNKYHKYSTPGFNEPLAIANHSLLTVRDSTALWSTDWGETFEDVTPADGLYNQYTQISPDGTVWFLNGKSGLCRSIDHGNNWENVAPGLHFKQIVFHPSGRYYAIFYNNATPSMLWYSDNEGQTWQQMFPLGAEIVTMVFVSSAGHIFLLLYDPVNFLLVRSKDNGASWEASPAGSDLSSEVSEFHENAAGHFFTFQFSSGNLRSLNQGVSWHLLPKVEDNFPEWDLQLFSSGGMSPDQHLYLGIYSGGLVRTGKPTTTGAYLEGTVLRDADADCSTPDAQFPSENWKIKVEGNATWYGTTDSFGKYLMFVDTGIYQVSAISPQFLWWEICTGAQDIQLDELLSTDTADFAVAALAECPLMTIDVSTPLLRRCFENTVFVQYCNQGSETADSAWVDVELDPYLSFVSSAQPYNGLGNNTYRFFLGDVESGACDQFNLVVYVDCDSTVLGQTHCITAHAYPDTLCTPTPDWSGAQIEAVVECQDTSVQLQLRNTGDASSQALEYIIIEDDVVLMNGNNQYDPDEVLTMNFTANGHTWRIESQQEPGHPFSNTAVAFAEGCGGFESLGFINQFNVNTFQPSWDQTCVENTGSYDPNDKQGFPNGYGAEHRIRPGQELEYMIRFQNTGTDTAFTVVIRDTLSMWLDPATLRPGAASHPYSWELSGQGVLSFSFSNILLPDSNTNLAASQGFVTFKINQQPDVPLQTQIFNSAAIYFDFNQPVITNQTLHTVGVDYLVGTHAPKDFGKQNQVIVSPNPVAESAVFQIKEGIFNQHRIIVTDAYGRKIREEKISGKQHLFLRRGLPPGTYFFRVEDAGGRLMDSGKIILK